MVKVLESKTTGQCSMTLPKWLLGAMDLKPGDTVSLTFRSEYGLWEFYKVKA